MVTAWDRIYFTTLFSFECAKIAQTIDSALEVANGPADRIFVGGIAGSLMQERFLVEPQWHVIRFIRGLLDQAPAGSLQFDEFAEELYADDRAGTPIEDLIPDYDILDQITYRYPVRDAYFTHTSRGCIRKCSFCGVSKLEGGQRDTESLSGFVRVPGAVVTNETREFLAGMRRIVHEAIEAAGGKVRISRIRPVRAAAIGCGGGAMLRWRAF